MFIILRPLNRFSPPSLLSTCATKRQAKAASNQHRGLEPPPKPLHGVFGSCSYCKQHWSIAAISLSTMATAVPKSSPGDLSTFNIQHGFTEALVRGMRSSFLKDADYHHLTQCESLDDVRLNLSESDYSDSIAEFNSLTPNTLQKAAVDKVCSHIELYGNSLKLAFYGTTIAQRSSTSQVDSKWITLAILLLGNAFTEVSSMN